VGSYLCSVGLVVLNRRHLVGTQDPLDPATLARFLKIVADEIFEDRYAHDAPGAAHVAKKYKLDRSKLMDDIPAKAIWIIQKWDQKKIEGRRRGGRHNAAQGVRKGPTPRLIPAMLLGYMYLSPKDRKKKFQADHPCADSTYYDLQRRYREGRGRAEIEAAKTVEFERELHQLLPPEQPLVAQPSTYPAPQPGFIPFWVTHPS
jgi:hypothetical protein